MDVFAAEVVLFAFEETPNGFLPCEGQVFPIRDELSMFALLGARHGGDGVTTFALPDLRGAEPIPGTRYFIASSRANYPARNHF